MWLKCENVPIWIPCQSMIFDVAIKQTSRSCNLASVLENIAKPAWYILRVFVLQVNFQQTSIWITRQSVLTMRWNWLQRRVPWPVCYKMLQSHLGIFCHQVAGLYEEVSYLLLKNAYFCIICQMSTNIFLNPKPIVEFWRCNETDFNVE